MKYRYETHCHTSAFSACGKSTPEEQIRKFADLGYAGVFITEHINGSCVLDHTVTPWTEYVDTLYESYERAKKEGEKCGVDVFFGFEYGYRWAHFLIYGLGKEWLLENSDMLYSRPQDVLKRVRLSGGFIVHAHPFREGIELVRLFPDLIDAVEVINSSRTNLSNFRANAYADMLDLPKTAGSDIHITSQTRLGSVVTDHRLESVNDYIELIKSGAYHIDLTE